MNSIIILFFIVFSFVNGAVRLQLSYASTDSACDNPFRIDISYTGSNACYAESSNGYNYTYYDCDIEGGKFKVFQCVDSQCLNCPSNFTSVFSSLCNFDSYSNTYFSQICSANIPTLGTSRTYIQETISRGGTNCDATFDISRDIKYQGACERNGESQYINFYCNSTHIGQEYCSDSSCLDCDPIYWYLANTCSEGFEGGFYTQCINPEDTALKEVVTHYSDSQCTDAQEYIVYPTGAKDSCRPYNGVNYTKQYSVCNDRIHTKLFGCYDESCGNCDVIPESFYVGCAYSGNYTGNYFSQECLTMSDIVFNRENIHATYSDSCVDPTYTYDYYAYTNTCISLAPTQFTTYSCPSNSNNIIQHYCTDNLCTQNCFPILIPTNICSNGGTFYCQSVTTTGTSGSSTTTTSGSSTTTTSSPIIMTGGITTGNGNIIVVNIILIFTLMVFVF